MVHVTAYTDGSANVKSRLGGIGVYLYFDHDGKRIEDTQSVGFSNTKTGRMEILAMIHALARVNPDTRQRTKIVVFSDSQYVVNSVMQRWVWNWKQTEGLENRANGDLWELFLKVYDTYPRGHVHLKWVKGHAGILGNEIADMLAGEAYRGGDYRPDTHVVFSDGKLAYEQQAN